MTGQVDDASEKNRSAATSSGKRDDEAGREAREARKVRREKYAKAYRVHGISGVVAQADREVAGLRTQLAEAEARCESHCSAAVHEQLVENFRVLAGQVAAIRALAASYEARARNGQDYVIGRITVAEDIRAALVASSPTTQEAKK